MALGDASRCFAHLSREGRGEAINASAPQSEAESEAAARRDRRQSMMVPLNYANPRNLMLGGMTARLMDAAAGDPDEIVLTQRPGSAGEDRPN